ncbi:MAG TPA: LytR C-terminal domain-containing protein [Patescibacteria group bacterium]|nr:LytR C-terminal domain-containing protein [Patescibacteria group bacterium]
MKKTKNFVVPKVRQTILFIGLLIFLLVLAGLIIKTLLILNKSSVNPHHQFILQIMNQQQNILVVFSLDTGNMMEVFLQNSHGLITKQLSIPVDGTVHNIDPNSDITRNLLFHFHDSNATITIFDALQLFFFSHTISSDNIHKDTIILPASDAVSQQQIAKDFQDTTLYKENKSIAIVNATGISGLGTMLATLLSHIGANVISVTTAQQNKASSVILYNGEQSYTLQRMEHILRFQLQQTNTPSLADITITIGTKEGKNMMQ